MNDLNYPEVKQDAETRGGTETSQRILPNAGLDAAITGQLKVADKMFATFDRMAELRKRLQAEGKLPDFLNDGILGVFCLQYVEANRHADPRFEEYLEISNLMHLVEAHDGATGGQSMESLRRTRYPRMIKIRAYLASRLFSILK